MVNFQQGVVVRPQLGLALEVSGRIIRVVELHPVDVHEERLVILVVLHDVINGALGLLRIDVGEIVVVEVLNHARRLLASLAFPLTVVDHLVVPGHELLVVPRERWMLLGIRVGVDSGVVGQEVFHFIVAEVSRERFLDVTQMPLAGEIGLVPAVLEPLTHTPAPRQKIILRTGA